MYFLFIFFYICKGSSVGAAITYITCGYLISMFDWESVFYVSGGMGFIWMVCWAFLVYDTPAKHPTISIREKTYIQNCIGNAIHTRSKPVRKIKIIRNRGVLAVYISTKYL